MLTDALISSVLAMFVHETMACALKSDRKWRSCDEYEHLKEEQLSTIEKFDKMYV